MDVHRAAPVQTAFQQPLRCGLPGTEAALPFGLPTFLVRDPPVHQGKLPRGLVFDDATGETQHVETRQGTVFVHTFDSSEESGKREERDAPVLTGPRTLGSVPRPPKKPRRLVADGRAYLWTLRHSHSHSHSAAGSGRTCCQTLTLYPQPTGSGGPLRIVFTEGPGRYVPGGPPLGSGDVGFVRGATLNLHEPGAVRALLDAASRRGWQPGTRAAVEIDGWSLLEPAAAARAGATGRADAITQQPATHHEAGMAARFH